jgi:hypothetical protein
MYIVQQILNMDDVIQIPLDSFLSLQIGKSVCWMLRLESMYARVHN